MKKCRNTCGRLCLWCVLQGAALPLEHGLWEWTGLYRALPFVGLHL